MQKITKIDAIPTLVRKLRVCAYARVSTDKEAMLNSLSAQVSYYNRLISSNPDYSFVGVYSDEAISGTKANRKGFNEMLDACRRGEIDLIITKSISRFARNTVTMLETTRELKALGVDVFFEEQNLHTISGDGELILTLLAVVAETEAKNVSENMKWRIKKNFQEGIAWGARSYGYIYEKDRFIIVPEEAKVVRYIYDLYIAGLGRLAIARKLNEEGYKTRGGKAWCETSVSVILQNYNYTGNMIFQKTYREDFITKRTKKNNGERTQYYVEEAHEAIIPIEIFNQAQEIRTKRYKKTKGKSYGNSECPLVSYIKCGTCGRNYQRKVSQYRTYWLCRTFSKHGKNACSSKQIAESELYMVINEVLGFTNGFDEVVFKKKVKAIWIYSDNTLEVELLNGTKIKKSWNTLSRKDSWTPEMKNKARERSLIQYGKSNSHSTND